MGFTGCNVDQKAQQTGTRRQPRNEIDLLEKIKERGSIIVSTDPNYAPQSYVNEDGEFAGFDIDVASRKSNFFSHHSTFFNSTFDWPISF